MERTFTVGQHETGERLDKWLCKKMPSVSRNQIKALLDNGRVLVNRRRVLIAGWELESGDDVEVRDIESFGRVHQDEAPPTRPIGRHPQHTHETPHVRASIDRHIERRHKQPEPLGETRPPREPTAHRRGGRARPPREQAHLRGGRVHIYHEDKDVIVVEKPAGIIAVSEKGHVQSGEDMISHVRAYLKRKHRTSGGSFVAPLHRLDTETSGLMVFALSRVGQNLERQFRDHSIRREYTALVQGRLEEENGVIDIPLEKGNFHGGKKVRRAEKGQGKRAVTEFSVKERYKDTTLLSLKVRTGRTHQIRVHLAEKGFPIIGDKLYSGTDTSFHRQALHANLLGFKHPSTGKKLTFHSPIPADMRDLIDKLRQSI